MQRNRTTEHLKPMGVFSPSSQDNAKPAPAFVLCPTNSGQECWQQLLYRAAYEMALAETQSERITRLLAASVN